MTFPSASLGVESAISLEATPCWPSAQLRSNPRVGYTHHVSECINKIQLLRNIESLWSAFPSPETDLFQDFYGGDGRWAAAAKCMGNDTRKRILDVYSKRRNQDLRVVTRGQLFARGPEVCETTGSDTVRLVYDLRKFFQGGESRQDCRLGELPCTRIY